MSNLPEVSISPEQGEAIAKGLFAVARADGQVHERELFLVKSFFHDAVGGDTGRLGELEAGKDPSAEELARELAGPGLAQVFLQTALLVAWADNQVTPAERALVDRYAQALGVGKEDVDRLEQSVKESLVGQLARLANTEAVTEVAKKLGVS